MFILLMLFISAPFAYSQTNISLREMDFSYFKQMQFKPTLLVTNDTIMNSGGESSSGKNLGALEFIIDSDLSKFSSLKGEIQIHFAHLERFGNQMVIGDCQSASNIDVNTQADRMIDLWYANQWSHNTSTLFGLHDLSTEFNLTEFSLNFMNASFGTGAELAYSGLNGPSIFPYTGLGARLLQNFGAAVSYRIGIYDGDPGVSEPSSTFHSHLGGKDGYFLINELAHNYKTQKNAFGFWNYTTLRDKHLLNPAGEHESDNIKEKENSFGAYYLFEKRMNDTLAVFIRYGWSNPGVAMIHSNTAVGGVYRGIFQTRKSIDELGLGCTHVHFSQGHAGAQNVLSSETTYESYYQFSGGKSITLRPDVQFIHQPAGSRVLKDAWVLAFRTIIEL